MDEQQVINASLRDDFDTTRRVGTTSQEELTITSNSKYREFPPR